MVCDLVSLVLEIPPDSFDVVVRPPALDAETLALIEEAIASRIAAQDLQVRASARLRQAAVELTGSGLRFATPGGCWASRTSASPSSSTRRAGSRPPADEAS